MTDYLARLFYLGDRYYGSQYQPGIDTVQGKLIDALASWSGETHSPQTIQLSGRTDRGVHSLGQLVMVSTGKRIDVDKINRHLPEDIQLWASAKAPIDFKPRYSVLMRHYRYYLPKSWEFIDRIVVKKAINILIGSNDYNHLSKPDNGRNTMTTILNISLQDTNSRFWFDIIGTRFLWKLVRKIVTLVSDVGTGEIRLDEVNDILTGKVSIPSGIEPAPPENLVLLESVVPHRMKTSKYAIRRILAHLKERFEYHNRSMRTLDNLIDLFSGPRMTSQHSTKKQNPSEPLD
ncbi:MAG: tRNA pseudouridine(38-40) synthase TruA [Candidatus Thorarchaeota archaeon]|jgi:tRNA pseudouridine38-40 synthase